MGHNIALSDASSRMRGFWCQSWSLSHQNDRQKCPHLPSKYTILETKTSDCNECIEALTHIHLYMVTCVNAVNNGDEVSMVE